MSPRDRRASSPRRRASSENEPDHYSLSDSELSDLSDLDTPFTSLDVSKTSVNRSKSASKHATPDRKSREQSEQRSRDQIRQLSVERVPRIEVNALQQQSPRSPRSNRSNRASQSPGSTPRSAGNHSNRDRSNLNRSTLSDRSRARLESDLLEKQREISSLEKIVEELNGELRSSQKKLTEFMEHNKQARDAQKRNFDAWHRDQITKMVSPENYAELNEQLLESRAQLDEVNNERVVVIDELEKIQGRVRNLQQDKRELKESCDELRDEIRVRDENIDRLQDQNIQEYEEQINQEHESEYYR